MTFQCDKKHLSYVKNICTMQLLLTTLDAQGQGATYKVVDLTNLLG